MKERKLDSKPIKLEQDSKSNCSVLFKNYLTCFIVIIPCIIKLKCLKRNGLHY